MGWKHSSTLLELLELKINILIRSICGCHLSCKDGGVESKNSGIGESTGSRKE